MPPQAGQNALTQKLLQRGQAAHAAHVNDETTYGNPVLPGGIEGGVAQLRQCRLGEYKPGTPHAGEPYFYAAGVVVFPKSHKGVPVEGLRTTVGPIPLCDTPNATGRYKTYADHYGRMMNVLAQFGIDRKLMVPQNLEALCKALEQGKPHFRFRTWQGRKQTLAPDAQGKWRLYDEDAAGNRTPNNTRGGPWANEALARKACPYAGREPLVNHEWNGACVWDANATEGGNAATPAERLTRGGYVEDASDDGEALPAVAPVATNGAAAQPQQRARPVPRAAATTPPQPVDPEPMTGEPPPEDDSGGEAYPDEGGGSYDADDPMVLADLADGGDEEAKRALMRLVDAAGIAREAAKNADNWGVVAAMLDGTNATSGLAPEPDVEQAPDAVEDDWQPRKGELYDYRPFAIDPRTKKPGKERVAEPVECEVAAVDVDAKTMTLRSVKNKRQQWQRVPWDDLTV